MKSDAIYTQAIDDNLFWLKVCERSLNLIWDKPEDVIYAELLKADVSIPQQS